MRKATYLFLLLTLCYSSKVFAQCLTPPTPPGCTGTDPQLGDNEILNKGFSKWYSGAPVVMNELTMRGGTLTVCTDLTIDKFYMDSGTIYIRPGARFIVGSGIGSGLIFQGNCAIYNYGFCEIQRNLSFANTWVSAAKPNVVINALGSSVFRTANQYFVINSPYSYFVNNGASEFWGIITDPLTAPGAICLGPGSTTRMAVLINKIADTYIVSSGNACVYVSQFSQFNNRLTANPNLFACLSSGHSSYSGCGGCPANNWGAAQVFTSCASCAALGVLPVQFTAFNGFAAAGGNRLSWALSNTSQNGMFYILRSSNGKDFSVIDSVAVMQQGINNFNYNDAMPLYGDNYYMIQYSTPQSGMPLASRSIMIAAQKENTIAVFPMPFENKFYINYPAGDSPEKIIVTDVSGKNLAIKYTIKPQSHLVEVDVSADIPAGIYLLHMRTNKQNIAKTILKK